MLARMDTISHSDGKTDADLFLVAQLKDKPLNFNLSTRSCSSQRCETPGLYRMEEEEKAEFLVRIEDQLELLHTQAHSTVPTTAQYLQSLAVCG